MATVSNEELKRFLDAKKSNTRLLGDVERYLLKRPKGDRRTDVLHPSEIIKRDWCRRASFYLLKGYPKIAPNPTLRMQVIFDEGHAIHAKWQSWFQDMGVLHGKFKCLSCKQMTWGTSPETCEACGRKDLLEYAEVTLIDEELRIAGHTDGWIKGIGDDCLIEIKSIGPGTIRHAAPGIMAEAEGDLGKAWGRITRPFPEHILQGQVYLELMRRMGNEVNEIVFLYELKMDQSFKEFKVKRDYELVAHVFEGAKKVVEAVEADVAPPCNNNLGGNCPQCSPYKEE